MSLDDRGVNDGLG